MHHLSCSPPVPALRSRACWSSALLGAALLGWTSLLSGQNYAPPAGYYTSAEGLLGSPLHTALATITGNATTVTYNDITSMIRVLDEDPANPNNLILIYSGFSMAKSAFGTSGSSVWNREHLWPQSYGAESGGANSDAHHLFPANASANSLRSNYYFNNVPGGSTSNLAPGCRYDLALGVWEPRDADKGRVARALFYMETRYETGGSSGDFRLSNRPNSSALTMGMLDALLDWNRRFPPDSYERKRNHLIHTGITVGSRTYRQGNRNPYIDYPDLVDAAFTSTQYVSRGSWRIEHFTFAQLDQPATSDDLSDPDDDGWPNLVELFCDSDPLTPTALPVAPALADDDGRYQFSFPRLRRPEVSQITHAVEYSDTPYQADSWQPWNPAVGDWTVAAGNRTETATLSDVALPRPEGRRFFRLVISRQSPDGSVPRVVVDPNLGRSPEHSLVRYEEEVEGLKYLPWFGFILDASYPWAWHHQHGWIYLVGESPSAFWMYDFAGGWMFTGESYYPFLYSFGAARWLYFLSDQPAPDRLLWDPAAGRVVPESEWSTLSPLP